MRLFLCFSPKWNNGLTAKVNDYVDNTISMLVPFMQQNGLDPMELPSIEEGFEVVSIVLFILSRSNEENFKNYII